ncbi:MAG: pyridoxamine 5'-phosphate oxidase family protein, partial [Dehalococcoidia bacterium]
PSRRAQIAFTEEEQEAFINEGWTLQCATIGPRGFPHLIAMWYVVDRGEIVFTTFGKSQKVMNLRRSPRITVMLEAGRGYAELRGVVIEGNAEIGEAPAETARIMALVGEKYNGIPVPTDTPESALRAASKRVTVRIKPVDVYSWDHRKLGGGY